MIDVQAVATKVEHFGLILQAENYFLPLTP